MFSRRTLNVKCKLSSTFGHANPNRPRIASLHSVAQAQAYQRCIVTKLIMNSSLCAECSACVLGTRQAHPVGPGERFSYPHHNSFSDLSRAAEAGCQVCRPFWSLFKPEEQKWLCEQWEQISRTTTNLMQLTVHYSPWSASTDLRFEFAVWHRLQDLSAELTNRFDDARRKREDNIGPATYMELQSCQGSLKRLS